MLPNRDGAVPDRVSAPDALARDASSPGPEAGLDAQTPAPDAAGVPDARPPGLDAASIPDAAVARDASAPDTGPMVGGSDASTPDAGPMGGGSDAGPVGDGGSGMTGYTVTRMMTGAMCDAMGTFADTGVSGDDDAMTSPVAMPFAFSYYGASASHWSASTNGIAQLWTSSAGAPSSEYSNTALPDMTAPEGMLAAFWDDLTVDSPAVLQTATLGTAPARRFVIEWRDVSSISGDETLRFQIKLFEGSNVIEYHYCSMTTAGLDDRHTGESATVGLQNYDGSRGEQVALDTAGTTPTGALIRFTPR